MSTRSTLFAVLAAILLPFTLQAGTWENYSNVTEVTDAWELDGHVWTTCKGGVVDFDMAAGTKTVYAMGDAGLPSADIEQIAVEAASGTIWVGTYDAGVVMWDGDNWNTWEYPTDFLLYRMKIDGFGNLWLQTDGGLYQFDKTTHAYTFVNSVGGAGWDFNAWDFDLTSDNEVLIFTGTSCLLIDAATLAPIDSFPNSDSPLVLACTPNSVRAYKVDANRYLISNFGFLEFENKDGSFEDATSGLPAFAFVNDISRGVDDALYALVNNTEIYMLAGDAWEFQASIAPSIGAKLVYADANSFYVSKSVYLEAPVLLHKTDMDLTTFDPSLYVFGSNNIRGLASDAYDFVYMASGSAMYKYNILNDNWDLFQTVPSAYGQIYDLKFVNNTFYVVDYGNLITYYSGGTWSHIPLAAGYSSIYIYDYDVTADGTVYFINDEGLFRFNGTTTEHLLSGGGVFDPYLSVAYDAGRNVIWLGKMNGIVKYDFTTTELIDASDVPALNLGASVNEIQIDPSGNVWFGANNNRAYAYDGSDWADFSLGGGYAFILDFAFSGSKTYFMLGSGDEGGVYVYDSADGSYTIYDMAHEDGLISDRNNYIHLDIEGNLWIAHSDFGVSMYRDEIIIDPTEIVTNEQTIGLYPNPASQQLQIKSAINGNAKVQIYSTQGALLRSASIHANTIDISDLTSGMYILHMQYENGVSAQTTFIKE
ncbi:MAG: T9SS type A sorting domain-containing protein [Chitinophagales bacterium]